MAAESFINYIAWRSLIDISFSLDRCYQLLWLNWCLFAKTLLKNWKLFFSCSGQNYGPPARLRHLASLTNHEIIDSNLSHLTTWRSERLQSLGTWDYTCGSGLLFSPASTIPTITCHLNQLQLGCYTVTIMGRSRGSRGPLLNSLSLSYKSQSLPPW